MENEEKWEAFALNIEAHKAGGSKLEAHEVAEYLDDLHERWREVWAAIPRDANFDYIYAFRGGEDEDPRPFLFRKDPKNPRTHAIIDYNSGTEQWDVIQGPDQILEWLVENPPFNEVKHIGMLYEYAQSIERKSSPWTLFAALVGERMTRSGRVVDMHLPGDAILGNLMSIGTEDAEALGQALYEWGHYHDTATIYVALIDGYDALT